MHALAQKSETTRTIPEVLANVSRFVLGLATDQEGGGLRMHLEPEDTLLPRLLRGAGFCWKDAQGHQGGNQVLRNVPNGRNLAVIDKAEATLLHDMIATNNLEELWEIVCARELADKTNISADGIRSRFSKQAFVTRLNGILFDHSPEFVKHSMSEYCLFLYIQGRLTYTRLTVSRATAKSHASRAARRLASPNLPANPPG